MGRKDPQGGGVYADCWHVPGGGVEGDETKESALIREIKEEVGIDIIPYAIEFVTDEDGDTVEQVLRETGEKVIAEMRFNVYKIVLRDKKALEVPLLLSDDLIEARWFTPLEMQQVKLTPPSQRFFSKRGYSV